MNLTDSFLNLNTTNTDDGNTQLRTDNNVFGISFLKDNFLDEKEKVRYIKKIESMVRSSQEYREFVSYIREELQFNHCSLLNTLTSDNVSVELHHHPFNLFDIVETEINKHIVKGDLFNTFIISANVMNTHYKNYIGLIPLSKTMHELVHSADSSRITLPKKLVIGNFGQYYNENNLYMEDSTKEKYTTWLELDSMLTEDDLNRNDLVLFNSNKRTSQLNRTSIYSTDELLLENSDAR